MIGQVRRESSTVVAVVGEVQEILLAEVNRSPNVSVVRPPHDADDDGNGLEAAARALRSASGRASAFVLVAADPLAAVAAEWSAMWDLAAPAPPPAGRRPAGIAPRQGPRGGAEFERRAAEALAAWRAGRFELPDYYLVLATAEADGVTQESGFHLGPLRAARPRRVAVVGIGDSPGQASRVLDALRSLPHGPWWPPMGELIDTARRFFAGSLAEGEHALAGPAVGG